MRSSVAALTSCLLAVCLGACSEQKPPPQPPIDAASPPPGTDAGTEQVDGSEAEAEADKGPKDTIRVATFNLNWAHDHDGEATSTGKKARAKDEAAWKWKASQIGKVLAKNAPDIVALQELGGEDEIYDIMQAIKEAKGPEYDYAFVKSEDPFSGHQLAVLSTFPLTDARRLDIHLRRHVAVDVELPEDQRLTVIAIHAPEGGGRAETSRQKQVKALKRAVDSLRTKAPVVVLGTLGSNVTPRDDKYSSSAAGMLAGRTTSAPEDDCVDANDVGIVVSTTREGAVADSIFACGVEITEADTYDEGIVRGIADSADKPWSEIPVDKDDERDVSDHLMLVATVKRPVPAPPPEEEKSAAEGDKEASAEETAQKGGGEPSKADPGKAEADG